MELEDIRYLLTLPRRTAVQVLAFWRKQDPVGWMLFAMKMDEEFVRRMGK